MQTTANNSVSSAVPSQAKPVSRFDLYGPIHKALRACLFDTVLRVGRLDLADVGELGRTCGQVDALAATLRSHLEHENKFIHGLMDRLVAGSADEASDDHDHHLTEIATIEALNALLIAAPSRGTCDALYQHLALVTAGNLTHMHMEETKHQTLLWARCSDSALLAVEQQIVAGLSPQEFTQMLVWMLPAISPAARAEMLSSIRRDAPPQVFDMVLGIARTNLDSIPWTKLANALDLPVFPGLGLGMATEIEVNQN